MQRHRSLSLPWSWWIRGGERLSLGLDIRNVLDGAGTDFGKREAAALKECSQKVEEGYGLVDSMKRVGVYLPMEAWCLLEAGERTGRMGEAMIDTGNLIRESEIRRRDFIGQVWYPVVVLLTGLLVMCIILVWVVPQMREISRSMGQGGEMPWLTENIGKLYGLTMGSLVMIGLLITGGWISAGYAGRRSIRWATWRELIASHTPLAGAIRKARRETRILRQLATLLKGGITLPDALQMASDNSPDMYERTHLLEFRKRLLMGISFEDSLAAFPLFSQFNYPILVTGQESGQLDDYLNRLAVDLDKDVSWRLKQALRILEPAMIFCLTILIAGLVMAYLLPTIGMIEQLA